MDLSYNFSHGYSASYHSHESSPFRHFSLPKMKSFSLIIFDLFQWEFLSIISHWRKWNLKKRSFPIPSRIHFSFSTHIFRIEKLPHILHCGIDLVTVYFLLINTGFLFKQTLFFLSLFCLLLTDDPYFHSSFLTNFSTIITPFWILEFFSGVNFSTSFLSSVLVFTVVVFEYPRRQAYYFAFLCFPDCSTCCIFTDFPDSPVSPEVSLIWPLAQQVPINPQLPIQPALSYTISSNPHLHSTLPPGTSLERSSLDEL